MTYRTTIPVRLDSGALEQHSELRVDGARLLTDLAALAAIGRDPSGGISRLGFGPSDNAARRFLAGLASAAGLASRVDQAGNVFVHRADLTSWPPVAPVLLIGSHLDTVPRGGSLDGAYGVMAGLEVLRTLADQAIELPHEPVLVAFANEEGALFEQPFWGSKALTGQLSNAQSTCDRFGNSIREPLAEAGGDLARIDEARWRPDSIAAYLELHIEQGPVLDKSQIPIGVVSGITGRTILQTSVVGKQNHAGTTPMDHRNDALTAAARMVLEIERIAATEQLCSVSTVGALTVGPGQTNVVPGLVEFTAEIRDSQHKQLHIAEQAVRRAIVELAAQTGVVAEVTTNMRSEPVHTAPRLRTAIEDAANGLEVGWLAMPSGAGHDAQIVAALAPTGVIFVPSRDGISHAPEEYTEPHQLICGANVLLQTALRT